MTSFPWIGSLVLAGAAGFVRSTPHSTPARAETIAFAPAEGLVLRKTFRRELRLGLESVGWEQDGFLAPANDGRWIDRQDVVFTDSYGALVDGLPARLRRTYEVVRLEHEHDLTLGLPSFFEVRLHVPTRGRGVLEGRSVEFTRTEGAERAVCASGDGKTLDETARESLREYADLRGLLPWEEEAVGDVWFTDVEAFRQLCWPGGEMVFVDEDDDVLSKPVDRIAARDLDGTFRVRFVDLREVGGRSVARLALRCVLEAGTSFEHELSVATGDRTSRSASTSSCGRSSASTSLPRGRPTGTSRAGTSRR